MKKKVLLIGGGGTIGTYVAKEMLEKGHMVDIICLENYVSDNENLRYINESVTYEFLEDLISKNHYDGIMNLIHYNSPEEYIKVHELLAKNTEHVIVVSSIRAIGNEQHPITETAPLIYDLLKDEEYKNKYFNNKYGDFLINKEFYSLTKALIEEYMHNVDTLKNWTIVRPMINTSDKRFDIVTNTFHKVIDYAKEGKEMPVPEYCRWNVAGLEWAGNTGKMVANIFFNDKCKGQTYNLSTAHRMTWDDVANIYTSLLGVKFNWIPNEKFEDWSVPIIYDRGYNRDLDNTKLLNDTGLKQEDFVAFADGVKLELEKVGAI